RRKRRSERTSPTHTTHLPYRTTCQSTCQHSPRHSANHCHFVVPRNSTRGSFFVGFLTQKFRDLRDFEEGNFIGYNSKIMDLSQLLRNCTPDIYRRGGAIVLVRLFNNL